MSANQNKIKVKSVIFDLDGTLIDSIDIYFTIVENALEKLGLPVVSRDKILAAAESENFKWELVLPQEVLKQKENIIAEAWAAINEIAPPMFEKNLKLIQGADSILQNLATQGLKLGLVTSTQNRYLQTKMQPLKDAGVEDVFAVIITSDDVEKRKPDPEPLIACVRRLDMDADNCVYVGDTATDMKAGKAAGMRTVGVLTGFDEYAVLEKEKPDAIVDSIRDLMEVVLIKQP